MQHANAARNGNEGPPPRFLEKVPKPAVRKRVPWSDYEVKTLIKAVALHGSQWSTIEGQYRNNFVSRDQVALKDKARNMMRSIIDRQGDEGVAQWYRKYPRWREVTVGAARRGVHSYDPRAEIYPPPRAPMNAQNIMDMDIDEDDDEDDE